MLDTLPPTAAHAPPDHFAPDVEPLSRTYDLPVRGPVLLASAGTSHSDSTFRLARAVADQFGTAVEVAAVIEPYPVYLMGADVPVCPPEFESEHRLALTSAIRARLEALGGGAERWPVSIFYGDPAGIVVRYAREIDASVIVVGLGRHHLRDRLLGEERALRVVRAADRPVLAVAPDAAALPRTAVVGVDFSPASVRAARAALLTLADGGRLILVNVRPLIEPPVSWVGGGMSAPAYATLVDRWTREAAAETATLFARLRDELRPFVRPGITVETHVRTGTALCQLLEVADEVGAEMLAVGTHGAKFVERLFVGSVAADVMRAAGRTVLVAPAPSPAESARITLRLRGTAELRTHDDWASTLQAFSTRNAGRRARLEVNDPDVGAQVQQSGFALLGVAYDRRDGRVEIMMGDPLQSTRHLTRTIPHAGDVAIYATPDGREHALRIASGRGQTLLTFVD